MLPWWVTSDDKVGIIKTLGIQCFRIYCRHYTCWTSSALQLNHLVASLWQSMAKLHEFVIRTLLWNREKAPRKYRQSFLLLFFDGKRAMSVNIVWLFIMSTPGGMYKQRPASLFVEDYITHSLMYLLYKSHCCFRISVMKRRWISPGVNRYSWIG